MTVLGASALGIGAVFLVLYIKPQQKEMAVLLGISTVLVLFSASVRNAAGACAQIMQYAVEEGLQENMQTLLKGLGIALTGQIAADICREAGESVIGNHLEQFARIEILLLSLPMAVQLLRFVREMLG